MDGCADDHPETETLREAVAETLEDRYPTVGTLIDDGFLPYFDTLDGDDDAYSHWLSPDYIGDDHTLDPDRPESVLVDNETWRAIGVMFIATDRGEPVDRPPVVYGDRDDLEVDDHHDDDHHDDHDHHHADEYCAPWHYHVGLPGRFAWWYYRQVHEGDYRGGEVLLPCETPCMMHVWTVSHPDSVYAHDPPPRETREDDPADAGFDTDAEPGEDRLDWEALPDSLEPEVKPGDLSLLEG